MKRQLMKFIPILLTAALLSACAGVKPPPMAKLTNYQPQLKVQTVWSRRVGDGTDDRYLKLNPALVGDTIYTTSYDGEVTALNAMNGREIWQTKLKNQLTSGPAVAANKVIVGTDDGDIIALNATNGQVIWQAKVSSGVLAAPVIAKNIVLVKTEDNKTMAFDLESGAKRWDYIQSTPSLILRGSSRPVVYGNDVVLGFANGKIAVFTLQTGALLWSRQVAEPQGGIGIQQLVDIDDTPIVENGVIYVATYQGQIAALRLSSGASLWQHPISSFAGIAATGHHIIVSTADSHVVSFIKKSGVMAWQQNNLFGRWLTGPAVMPAAVVLADAEGYVHFLSLTDGSFLARVRASKKAINATPIVAANNNVFIYTNQGELIRYQVSAE